MYNCMCQSTEKIMTFQQSPLLYHTQHHVHWKCCLLQQLLQAVSASARLLLPSFDVWSVKPAFQVGVDDYVTLHVCVWCSRGLLSKLCGGV